MSFDREALGARMREAREAAGLSIWDCAALMGMSRSLLYRYENGRQCPWPRSIERFAEACGITPRALLDGARPLENDWFILEIAPLVKALTPANRKIVLEVLTDLRDNARRR